MKVPEKKWGALKIIMTYQYNQYIFWNSIHFVSDIAFICTLFCDKLITQTIFSLDCMTAQISLLPDYKKNQISMALAVHDFYRYYRRMKLYSIKWKTVIINY